MQNTDDITEKLIVKLEVELEEAEKRLNKLSEFIRTKQISPASYREQLVSQEAGMKQYATALNNRISLLKQIGNTITVEDYPEEYDYDKNSI